MYLPSKANGLPRRRQRRRFASYVGLVFSVALYLDGVSCTLTRSSRREASYNDAAGPLLSQEWAEWYMSGEDGCAGPWNHYQWRPAGLGSNLMYFMDQWLYGLVMQDMRDIAVLVEPEQLQMVNCTGTDNELLHGFDCLFTPMPHVCSFGSYESWLNHTQEFGIERIPRMKASRRVRFGYISSPSVRGALRNTLQRQGTDLFTAIAALARILWNHLAPWAEEDALKRIERVGGNTFHQSPYIGLHIRRGDKILEHEMASIDTVDYLKAAKDYLGDPEGNDRPKAGDVKGIWVASDDPTAVEEVRALAPAFFPGITKEAILSVADDVDINTERATHSNYMDYGAFVSIVADIQLLAGADVFVGTFTSNIGRIVALLRNGESKPTKSSISLDEKEFEVYYEYEHVVRK